MYVMIYIEGTKMRLRTLLGAILLLAAAGLMALAAVMQGGAAHGRGGPKIAVAANLRLALDEIAAAFERDTGEEVTLVFGSSGDFVRQLQQGAPFELFLSADEEYVLELARSGKTQGEGALYALGRLAIVAPRDSPLQVDANLAGLRRALAIRRITRFAIANPEHAPYGARSVEALGHARLWKAIEPRLVLGENVSQALQFAMAGAGQGGIVAYPLVLDPALRDRIRYASIPVSAHQPLRQRMVLMEGAGPVARRFYAYMQEPAAQRILTRHGYALPGGKR
jgi:molybdate transport system substrate-binding protein